MLVTMLYLELLLGSSYILGAGTHSTVQYGALYIIIDSYYWIHNSYKRSC